MWSNKDQGEVDTEDRQRESLKNEKGGEVLPSTKERKSHIWKNPIDEWLCVGPSVKVVNVSEEAHRSEESRSPLIWIISQHILRKQCNIHPWVKCLFSPRIVPSLLLAGRLNHFLEVLEILTKDPEILELVKGVKIPFLKNPTQKRVPQTPHMSQEQAVLIQVETENMLKNGVIQQTEHQTGEFISNIFLTRKRDGENRSEWT